MTTRLDALRCHSAVVADTGDLEAIARYRPQDATTNPSLMLQAVADARHTAVVDEVLARHPADPNWLDALQIEFGCRILNLIPGRVSTEVDPRLSFDTAATEARALALIERYAAAGVPASRVLIKIASTWEGIRAAARLERQGVHCNLTLLFSLVQAAACADAGVTLVSPFVGRVHDWHLKARGVTEIVNADDPGVELVRKIYRYFRTHGYATEVMAASFRKLAQIVDLAGCDLLTISPELLAQLDAAQGDVPRRLHAANSGGADIARLELDEGAFRWQLNEDAMASELLATGIRRFAADARKLETMVADRRGDA